MIEVWFLDNGYRTTPPYGVAYRPHLVAENTDDYLGVEFVHLEESAFDEHILCRINLLYDDVDYAELKQGVSFEIREGPHVVGKGYVVISP